MERIGALLAESLIAQGRERDSGYTVPNTPLMELTTEFDFATLRREVSGLRRGGIDERQLYASILVYSDMPADRRFAEVSEVLAEESAPAVIQWLVVGLRNAEETSALPVLRELARHPSPDVRFQVPDALSACTERFDDVADVLLALSRDPDADVRWSAVFELAVWWRDTKDGRIRERLLEAEADDVAEVRQAAELPDGDDS